jgi:hypothetical protein
LIEIWLKEITIDNIINKKKMQKQGEQNTYFRDGSIKETYNCLNFKKE